MKTHQRDATECVISIGYGLFAVNEAIFSNLNDLELIMNSIQTIVAIKKYKYKEIERKSPKNRYGDGVRTCNISTCDWYVHITF